MYINNYTVTSTVVCVCVYVGERNEIGYTYILIGALPPW